MHIQKSTNKYIAVTNPYGSLVEPENSTFSKQNIFSEIPHLMKIKRIATYIVFEKTIFVKSSFIELVLYAIVNMVIIHPRHMQIISNLTSNLSSIFIYGRYPTNSPNTKKIDAPVTH